VTDYRWQGDQQRQISFVEKVEPGADGWCITADSGWSIFVTSSQCAVEPQLGEPMVLFGRGIGYPVRGIVIGNRVYRYESAPEYEARMNIERLERARAADAKAKAERPERDARIAKLPALLQERIRRFLRVRDNFAAEYETYELFVCEEAAEIARVLVTREAIAAFSKASSNEEQARLVPKLRLGQHSGNTFGAACHIAAALVDAPSLVVGAHGALCPLVGCKDYGCWAAVEGPQAVST
jgi:hypothetical protein